MPKSVRSRYFQYIYSDHEAADVKRLQALAKKYDLIEVGGTDSGKPPVGAVTVPYKAVEELKAEKEMPKKLKKLLK